MKKSIIATLALLLFSIACTPTPKTETPTPGAEVGSFTVQGWFEADATAIQDGTLLLDDIVGFGVGSDRNGRGGHQWYGVMCSSATDTSLECNYASPNEYWYPYVVIADYVGEVTATEATFTIQLTYVDFDDSVTDEPVVWTFTNIRAPDRSTAASAASVLIYPDLGYATQRLTRGLSYD